MIIAINNLLAMLMGFGLIGLAFLPSKKGCILELALDYFLVFSGLCVIAYAAASMLGMWGAS